MLLFQIIVVISAANAIALEHDQYSVLYSSDKSASCPIVAKKFLQSTSADATFHCNPSPTDECLWERETSMVARQPLYERNDDILVKKPPRPMTGSEGQGFIGENNAGQLIVTGTESLNFPTIDTTTLEVITSVIATLPSLASRTTATILVDKSISPTSRTIASALTPAQASSTSSRDLGTSRNIADTSVNLASTALASVPTRSRELDTITTTIKQTTEPTNISKRSSLPVIPSSPSPPSPTPPSISTKPASTNPSSSSSKTPIVIGVGIAIGIAVGLTVLGIILLILKRRRRRSKTITPRDRASLPWYVDGKRELDAGIEQLAPQEIDGVEVGGPQEMMTGYNVPEIGIERDAPRELMTCDNVHEMG